MSIVFSEFTISDAFRQYNYEFRDRYESPLLEFAVLYPDTVFDNIMCPAI